MAALLVSPIAAEARSRSNEDLRRAIFSGFSNVFAVAGAGVSAGLEGNVRRGFAPPGSFYGFGAIGDLMRR